MLVLTWPLILAAVAQLINRVQLDELQHGGRKPTETSVSEFCYKSVNLFFEKLININIILFPVHELFRWQNFLKWVIFLTYMTALLAVM